MTIKQNEISFFEALSFMLSNKQLFIFLTIFYTCLILVLLFIHFVFRDIFSIKKFIIYLTSIIAITLICALTSYMFMTLSNNQYYSINGSAKITDIKPYSTNGNLDDKNTQTIYFKHNNHIYNIQSPDNTVIKKDDTINIKSSKFGVTIDNGSIEKSHITNQTLDIKINSKN